MIFILVASKGCKPGVSPPFQKNNCKSRVGFWKRLSMLLLPSDLACIKLMNGAMVKFEGSSNMLSLFQKPTLDLQLFF